MYTHSGGETANDTRDPWHDQAFARGVKNTNIRHSIQPAEAGDTKEIGVVKNKIINGTEHPAVYLPVNISRLDSNLVSLYHKIVVMQY